MSAARFPRRPSLFVILLGILVSGPAGAGFIGVGRTDLLNGAPFLKMYSTARPEGKIAVLPVVLDPLSTGDPGDAGRRQALGVLADELDRYARSVGWMSAIDLRVPLGEAPVVYAGISDGDDAPAGVIMESDDGGRPQMILYCEKPSKAWRRELSPLLVERGLDGAIVVAIGFSEFPKSYSGVFKKRVVLGTGYDIDIRFLSAELQPVHVLYVTGVLLDRDGSVLGAGAEGVLAEDAPFWAQSFGIGKELDQESLVRGIGNERREDLPGSPPKLHVAFQNLIAQLLGDRSRIIE